MSEPGLRVDPLTGAHVIVTPWRQARPTHPQQSCPFCPGGLEAAQPYDVMWFPNRWPGLPDGRHEVVLYGPEHDSSLQALSPGRAAQVVELWTERTVALGSRADVAYVFIFENRGRSIGATIDHPHSQITAFGVIPPIPRQELSAQRCSLCADPEKSLLVAEHEGWRCWVPWAPSWPYEMLISARDHIADLPAAGPRSRMGLSRMMVESLSRLERLFGEGAPYMLWIHQRPTDGGRWPAAHVHVHLAPLLRGPGMVRHLASAELGAGILFIPVDPPEAARQLRNIRLRERLLPS